MATQPGDNPGNTPDEIPQSPEDPGFPGGPDETEPSSPAIDQPDSAPVELPPPD